MILLLVFVAVTLLCYVFLTRPRDVALPAPPRPGAVRGGTCPSGLVRFLYPCFTCSLPCSAPLPFAEYRRTLADTLRKASFGESMTVDHVFRSNRQRRRSPDGSPARDRLHQLAAIVLATMAVGFMLPDRLINDVEKARSQQALRTMPGAGDGLALGGGRPRLPGGHAALRRARHTRRAA